MWLATDVRVAAVGLLVTGLGLALQFPLSISRLMAVSSGRLDAATGWASLGAGLASGVAPFVLGALADAVGPHTGFLLVPALLGGPPPAAENAGRLPLRFWPALGLLMSCVAVEFCTTYWTGDLLHDRTGVPPRVGAALVSAVIIGMAIGRALASRLTRLAGLDALLGGTIVVAAIGWLVMWLSTDVRLAAVGLLITGLGLALQFPLSISRLMAVSSGRLDAATGWASLGAGLASGIAPFVLGALADAVGPHTGFLLVPGLLVMAVVMLFAPRARRALVAGGR
jgi:fucose permease